MIRKDFTKEEYDDFKQRICKVLDDLESRIAAIEELENSRARREFKEEQRRLIDAIFCKTELRFYAGLAELEGTKEQFEAFEMEIEKENDRLFPSNLSRIKTLRLALEHGLKIKSISTNYIVT